RSVRRDCVIEFASSHTVASGCEPIGRVLSGESSVRGVKTLDHGEVPHVRREQVRLENDRGCGDEVVGVVDAAVAATEALCQRPGGPADLLVDWNPGQR